MSLNTYEGYTTGRGPSPRIWGNCPWEEIQRDPNKGYCFWDDFFAGLTEDPDNATVFRSHPWYAYGTTGVTFAALATEVGGVCQVSQDADDEEFYLTTGNNTGVLGKFQIAATDTPFDLYFEARVRVGQIGNTYGMFCGLMEEAAAATGMFAADAASLVDKDYVGFRVIAADGGGLDIVHNTASGGGETVIQEAAVNTTYQTLVAATWKKIGLKFHDTTVTFYIDGVEIVSVETTATNFPAGEELAFVLGLRQHGAGTATLDIDWVRFAQVAA